MLEVFLFTAYLLCGFQQTVGIPKDTNFSPGTPTSSTTKTGRHGIAEILLSEAQHKNIKINQSIIFIKHSWTDSFNVSFNVFLTGHYCKCLGVC
jgi:hypothetical protein